MTARWGSAALTRAKAAVLATGIVALGACTGTDPAPAELDTATELCASCRMPVSDPRLAAQIVAPGEEPRFFDDIGCLRDYLAGNRPLPRRAALYVADHRTKAWTPVARARYTICPAVATPMGSHLLAHADAASRQRDAAARAGTPVAVGEALGTARAEGAAR
jgi:copper chaperone NosL